MFLGFQPVAVAAMTLQHRSHAGSERIAAIGVVISKSGRRHNGDEESRNPRRSPAPHSKELSASSNCLRNKREVHGRALGTWEGVAETSIIALAARAWSAWSSPALPSALDQINLGETEMRMTRHTERQTKRDAEWLDATAKLCPWPAHGKEKTEC